MQEVMAIIRMDMIGKTKEALSIAGFPALHAMKVMGRGKRKVDFALIESIMADQNVSSPLVAESLTEGHRLIPKRLLSIIVKDDEVKKLVDVIIEVNQKGHPGDGKIFVMPVDGSIRIRTGESGDITL
ncbi:MAG: P-II family nitrogen regulator [Syntrophomonadaceae bacterium]|nr:P-II family nitrogen regulator [Syntrophomonadaceae bacterium]